MTVPHASVAERHPGTLVPRSVRAVVFDMDGVLLDTERVWGRAEARLCAAHGVDFGEADEHATLGVLALEACRHYARRFGLPPEAARDLEAELLAFMADELEGPVDLLPGAAELIARLRERIPLAVASNSRRVVVERAIEKSGVGPDLAVVVSADDVARPKPAPNLYRLACTRLGVRPADALALEDSPVGAAAAIAAGLPTYLVSVSPPPAGLPVARCIATLTDLLSDARDASLARRLAPAEAEAAAAGSERQ